MIITLRHLRTIPYIGGKGYCTKGSRRICERYGIDWNEFVKNGLPEEVIMDAAGHDAQIINLIKHAHNCESESANK